MHCPWSARGSARLDNKISLQCKFRASRHLGRVYHSSDAALNIVRNAAHHDVNQVLSDVAEMSFWQRIEHNDEEVLCLHEDPRRVLRKQLPFVSHDVLWLRFAWITSSFSMS